MELYASSTFHFCPFLIFSYMFPTIGSSLNRSPVLAAAQGWQGPYITNLTPTTNISRSAWIFPIVHQFGMQEFEFQISYVTILIKNISLISGCMNFNLLIIRAVKTFSFLPKTTILATAVTK